jgi:hypothetical protein
MDISNERKRLRFVYILLNIFWYVMFIGESVFVLINWNGLIEINRLSISIFGSILLFFCSIFQSYRIRIWIKDGKL